jgi:hypothetical protein
MKSLTVTVNNKTQALKFLRWAQKQWPGKEIRTKQFFGGRFRYPCAITAPFGDDLDRGWMWEHPHLGIPFADFEAQYLDKELSFSYDKENPNV